MWRSGSVRRTAVYCPIPTNSATKTSGQFSLGWSDRRVSRNGTVDRVAANRILIGRVSALVGATATDDVI